jgi:lysozyme
MTTLEQMLIADEGLELKPYRCTGDKLTIGIGRNLDDVGISRDEALYLLANDIKRVERGLMSNSTFNALDESRKIAIMNMAFQLGVNGCLAFRNMWAALARKDWQGAHREALNSRWAKQTPNRANRIAAILLTGEIEGKK